MSDELDQAREFLRVHHHAVVITRRRDGLPQASPIVAALDDGGNACISTRTHAAKARNIRRESRVSLCVVTDAWFGPWLQVDGTAEVIDLPEAMSGLESIYRTVAGEHPNWDEFRTAMHEEERVLIRIRLEKAAGPALSPAL